jgi:hypothetical protein
VNDSPPRRRENVKNGFLCALCVSVVDIVFSASLRLGGEKENPRETVPLPLVGRGHAAFLLTWGIRSYMYRSST